MLTLSKILPIADRLMIEILPFCEIARIAGGIRREKFECHDIELVVIPKMKVTENRNLFEATTPTITVHPEYERIVSSWGKIRKGRFGGRMMQVDLKNGPPLDIFTPDPVDFYRQFVIRTGSVDYVRSTITAAWLRMGWCGAKGIGLRLQKDCELYITPEKKREWHLVNPRPELPPVWKSESEFYDWLGIPKIKPSQRIL